MINSLKNIIFRRNLSLIFDVHIENQKNYLNSFPDPKDCIERAYYQYKCQQFLQNRLLFHFLNLICLLLILPIILFFLIRNVFNDIDEPQIKSLKKTAVYPFKGKYGRIIPECFLKEYEINEIKNGELLGLKIKDLSFIYHVFKRAPTDFLFLSRIVYKLAQYSPLVYLYKPQAIFTSSEYSFTSTVMTEYCRQNSILHTNIMHGEKFYSLIDSFFEFDICSVWDSHYENIFIELRANPKQFVINKPESLSLNLDNTIPPVYYLTYYLGGENQSDLQRINSCLEQFISVGKRSCVRVHPRYSDVDYIKLTFHKSIDIQESDVSLKQSFEQTELVVSFFSTILYQGYLNNKTIVIDDLTRSREDLKQLKDLKYIIFSKQHEKLSELSTI